MVTLSGDPPTGHPSADGRPVGGSTDGSDPSADGSDRPMARHMYTCVYVGRSVGR